MSDNQQWNDELEYEERIQKILAIRNPRAEQKWWQIRELIPAMVAVLTVALSSWGTFLIQRQLNERNYAVERDKVGLDYSRQTIRETNNLVSDILKMNEERLKAAQGYFGKLSKDQKLKITDGTNVIQQNWRRERENAQLLFILDLEDQPGPSRLWSKVRAALERYTTCVEDAYGAYQDKIAPQEVCDEEKQDALRWRDSLHAKFYRQYNKYWVGLGSASPVTAQVAH